MNKVSIRKKGYFWMLLILVFLIIIIILVTLVRSNSLVNPPIYKIPWIVSSRLQTMGIEWEGETPHAEYRHRWTKTQWVGGMSGYSLEIKKKDIDISPEEFFLEIKDIMNPYLKTDVKIALEKLMFEDMPKKARISFEFNGENNSLSNIPARSISGDYPVLVSISELGYWEEVLAR